METLKKLEEIYLPDVRYRNRANVDLSTGQVTQTVVEDIHALVDGVRLGAGVPEDVRSHFETAKNLILYSWFVYSFNEVATMHAMVALEMAARAKTGNRKKPFKKLLDQLFPDRELAPGITLGEPVTYFRNKFAHGSSMVTGQGLMFVSRCAELINELYP